MGRGGALERREVEWGGVGWGGMKYVGMEWSGMERGGVEWRGVGWDGRAGMVWREVDIGTGLAEACMIWFTIKFYNTVDSGSWGLISTETRWA